MSKDYEVVIGLEIHVEIGTKTKIFCGCSAEFGAEPNTQICPTCAGFPGGLPVLNKQVVDLSIRAALAMHAKIADVCIFDRKNYFYPDLPTAYQITQFYKPICSNGYLDIEVEGNKKRVRINRAHIEEDAGKLVHQGDITSTPFSLVDLNRSGVGLLEIVSEPDMRSGQEARAYAEKLRSILLFAGVSDCKMQEGSMRFDANVSVRPWGQEKLGTRAEIKNLNSFAALEKAIKYESERQIEAIEDGEEIIQETRTWDDEKGVTRSMRSKEEAHDYRYFPDPDLPPVHISAEWIDAIQKAMPELPEKAQMRLIDKYGLTEYDANLLTVTPDYLGFFDECVAEYDDAKVIANWMMGELNRLLKQNAIEFEQCKLKPAMLVKMLRLIDSGKISNKMGKDIFEDMFTLGKDPEAIIKEKGLEQISGEDALIPLIDEAIKKNPKAVEDYRNGKQKALGAIVGQVMKMTKGQANPAVVNELILTRLN